MFGDARVVEGHVTESGTLGKIVASLNREPSGNLDLCIVPEKTWCSRHAATACALHLSTPRMPACGCANPASGTVCRSSVPRYSVSAASCGLRLGRQRGKENT